MKVKKGIANKAASIENFFAFAAREKLHSLRSLTFSRAAKANERRIKITNAANERQLGGASLIRVAFNARKSANQ